MVDGLAHVFSLYPIIVYEVDNGLHIYGRLIGRGFNYIWLRVEVAVVFRINKRYATGCILSVLECLDVGNATAVTPQTAYSKHALIEHCIEVSTKQTAMINHIVGDAIEVGGLSNGEIAIAGCAAVVLPAYHMQIYLASIRIAAVVLSHASHQAVEAMPVMYLCHCHKMYG